MGIAVGLSVGHWLVDVVYVLGNAPLLATRGNRTSAIGLGCATILYGSLRPSRVAYTRISPSL